MKKKKKKRKKQLTCLGVYLTGVTAAFSWALLRLPLGAPGPYYFKCSADPRTKVMLAGPS